MAIKTAIGLMSGTSMDGIDAALVRTDGKAMVERGSMGFYPYDANVQDTLKQALVEAKNLTHRDERTDFLKEAETLITQLHVEAVKAFLEENKMSASGIDVLGFHGQTVLHRPDQALTVQLGDGHALTKATGIDVVYDMRAKDMQHDGQGAPLVPVYHQALAASLPDVFKEKFPVVFVNIGGISNITFIGEELIAFDSGPGNALIDQWVQSEARIPYDQGGMIAAEGNVSNALVTKYLENQYFEKPLPKSLDRNDFLPPKSGEITVEDGARSLAYISAAAILKSIDHLPDTPKLWIICGGGRHNPHIMSDLQKLAEETNSQVIKAEEAGLDGDAMEAEAWGYLAIRSLEGLPLTFPKTTGCKHPVTGGVFAHAKHET
jgi:anhydro-N-acetylmuramic acid kinase